MPDGIIRPNQPILMPAGYLPSTELHVATKGYVDGNTGVGGGTVLLHEDFSSNPLADYTADQGTTLTGLSVTGGSLTTAVDENVDHSAHHNTVEFTDGKAMMKLTFGDGDWLAYLMLKYLDDNNFLMMQFDTNDTEGVSVYQRVAGSYTALNNPEINPAVLSSGEPLWMVARMTGAVLVTEVWNTDPRLGGTPYFKSMTTEIDVALATGISGAVGFRLHNKPTQTVAASIDEIVWVAADSANTVGF